MARVLLRVQLGAKLVSFFFESFPKESLLLTGLLASRSQPTMEQAIGEHSGSEDNVSFGGWNPVSPCYWKELLF